MFIPPTYLLIALVPLLSQPVTAHDPVYKLGQLVALPMSDECKTLSECKSILTSNCTDDTCACSFAAQAESCTRCIWTSESVDKYNGYLSACAALGKAAPSDSFATGAPATTEVQGQFTDIGGALGVETQAGGSGSAGLDLEQPSAGAQVIASSALPSNQVPAASVTAPTSIYRGVGGGQTQVQAGASSLPAPLNGGAASGTNGINVLNDTKSAQTQTPVAMDAGTTALNSSRNFFSQAISQACVRHCTAWKAQADVSNCFDG
jgi:hypothetical protein